MGWLQTCIGGGQVCGLFLAAALTQMPPHTGLLAAAGVTAFAALTAWLTTRTPPNLVTPKPALLQPPRPSEWPVSSPQHLFHYLTRTALHKGWQDLCSPFAIFLATWLLCLTGSAGYFSQYPVMMEQLYGVSPWLSFSGSAVAHGLGPSLYVPTGLWAERCGPERVLRNALSLRWLAFLSLVGLGFLPYTGRAWLAFLCVIVVILSWSLLSVSGTASTARLSREAEGEGMGLFNATTALAGVTGAALGGWVAEYWGYHLVLRLPVVGIALGLFLVLMVGPALELWNAYQAEYLTIALDDEGMQTDGLEAALRAGPKFIYVLPNFHNPAGVTLALERRQRLVDLADRYGVPLIEDDPYGQLRYEGEHLPALAVLDGQMPGRQGIPYSGNVLYLSTFSKTLAPGLRLGWVVAPSEVIHRLVQAKQGADLHTSNTHPDDCL